MQGILQRINDIAGDMRNDALIANSDALDATKGNGALKALAQQRLNEIVSLLNIKVDTDYLFAGRAAGTAPMQPFGDINSAGSILGQVAALNSSNALTTSTISGAQRYGAIKEFLANDITRQAPGGSAPAPYGFQGETGAPGGNSFRFTLETAANAGDTSITVTSSFDLPIPGQYVEFGGKSGSQRDIPDHRRQHGDTDHHLRPRSGSRGRRPRLRCRCRYGGQLQQPGVRQVDRRAHRRDN